MFRLLLLTISFCFMNACNQCNVKSGTYTSSGGSEYKTVLTLSKDNTFTITHDTWLPGQYEQRTTDTINGKWFCGGKGVVLETTDSKHIAKFITIGQNPLGLPKNTEALQFNNQKNTNSFLESEILYFAIEKEK